MLFSKLNFFEKGLTNNPALLAKIFQLPFAIILFIKEGKKHLQKLSQLPAAFYENVLQVPALLFL